MDLWVLDWTEMRPIVCVLNDSVRVVCVVRQWLYRK